MIKTKLNPKWNLVTIDDPSFLTGESILNVIRILLEKVIFKFVIIDYIYGSGKEGIIKSLWEKEDEIIKLEDLLSVISKADFEWGDFFLFKDYPLKWKNIEGMLYPEVISQTDTTVRAIDGQYIYVYTPYQEIVEALGKAYMVESIKANILEKLEYPE